MNKNQSPRRPICKTIRGEETDGFGYDAEVLVKKKLWKFGYRVRHVLAPYDLLVENKIKVEVKTGRYRVRKNGSLYWGIMLPSPYSIKNHCDVLAIILPQPISKPLLLFFTNEEVVRLFGNSEFGTTFSSNKLEKIKLGMKKVYEVFGKPASKGRAILKKEER